MDDTGPAVSASSGTSGDSALNETEIAILAFEKRWWKYPGAKETAVFEEFGLTPTRYYQLLNALLDRPAALALEPMTVRRLRRLRAARRDQRSPRTDADGT